MRLVDADVIEWHEYLAPMGNGQYEYSRVAYMDDIDAMPTIDPVQKGHWNKVDETPYIRKHFNVVCCSVCRKKGYTAWNYCPNCGAKMEEGE